MLILYDNLHYFFLHENIRSIRKLLESVDENHVLVLEWNGNQYETIGVAEIKSLSQEAAFFFSIINPMQWLLSFNSCNLFGYKNGKYVCYQSLSSESWEKAEQIVEGICSLERNFDSKSIWQKIADTIVKGHGVSLIVFADSRRCQEESQRLKLVNRCICPTSVIDFTDDAKLELLSQITRIDGGIIFDLSGKCYAYGVIFDGSIPSMKEMKDKKKFYRGNIARGARYNSLLLYVYSHLLQSKPCVGIVYSDDGSVDVISDSEDIFPTNSPFLMHGNENSS